MAPRVGVWHSPFPPLYLAGGQYDQGSVLYRVMKDRGSVLMIEGVFPDPAARPGALFQNRGLSRAIQGGLPPSGHGDPDFSPETPPSLRAKLPQCAREANELVAETPHEENRHLAPNKSEWESGRTR